MKFSSFFSFGSGLLVTSLLLTSAINASDMTSVEQEAWLQSIREVWAEEDSEFKNSPTSPLAGVSRFEISDTGTAFFVEKGGQLGWSPERGDRAEFSLTRNEDQWVWTGLADSVSLAREGEELSSGSTLAPGDRLKAGRFTIEVYPSADSINALVFDPDTERLREFKTLDRFEANPKFVVNSKMARFETPEQQDLITARQQFKKQYRYAKLHFEIDDVEHELTAYKHALEGEGSDILFVPFSDKTNGRYSYGGGRYLMVEEPSEGDEILIDFNLVTNPLCSYATIYNCIVPTTENRLRIAIEAGVKKYH